MFKNVTNKMCLRMGRTKCVEECDEEKVLRNVTKKMSLRMLPTKCAYKSYIAKLAVAGEYTDYFSEKG